MKKIFTALVLAAQLTGCATPSYPYLQGNGFYSGKYSEAYIQKQINIGKVQHLGRFETSAGGCWNYSKSAMDQNIIIPAISQQLALKGADAVYNVSARKRWLLDLSSIILVLPMLSGCGNWAIDGDALKIQH